MPLQNEATRPMGTDLTLERPRDEVAFYELSDDITLFVLAGTYHCHNVQDGRARLWDRLAAWGDRRSHSLRARSLRRS